MTLSTSNISNTASLGDFHSTFMPIYELGKRQEGPRRFTASERNKNRKILRHFFDQICQINGQLNAPILSQLRSLTVQIEKCVPENFNALISNGLEWYIQHEHMNPAQSGKIEQRQRNVENASLMLNILRPMSVLPNELLIHVLSFADKPSLAAAHQVSRQWNACGKLVKDSGKIAQVFPDNQTVSQVKLKELSVEIGLLWTQDKPRSKDLIQLMLNKLSKLPVYESSFCAKIIAQTWGHPSPSSSFAELADFVRGHELCDARFKLAFNRNWQNHQKAAEGQEASSAADQAAGLKIKAVDAFPRAMVSNETSKQLLVSARHHFEVGELVAIFESGNLAGTRQALFYASVTDVQQQTDGSPVYVCSSQYSKPLGSWVDQSYLRPEMIGKLPNTGYIQKALPPALLGITR